MSILGNVLKSVKRLVNRNSMHSFNIGLPEVYPDMNAEKAITKGFNNNTAVYSIVVEDAQKFSSIPRYVYDKHKISEKADNILENDLTNLINRPNEYQSQDAFFMLVRAYYKITGEAFIWLNRGDVGDSVNEFGELVQRSDEETSKLPVLEMYVLPSDKVILRADPDNLFGVLGYLLDVSGTRIDIRKSDVIHWKSVNLNFDPTTRTHLRGFSALVAGNKTLQQNDDATNAAVRMYQNDGAKGVLFNETLDKMTVEQESQIRSVVNSKINNNDIKGAVATLQGKWGYLNFGGSSVDLSLIEGKQMSWKELCFLLDVPYEFFNADTTFANKKEAQKSWVSNKIVPACKQFDGEMNRILLKAFGLENTAYIGSDFSELPEMQDDMEAMARGLAIMWWVSPNDKAEMQGFEKNPDARFDEPWIPSNIIPLSEYGNDAKIEEMAKQIQIDGTTNIRPGAEDNL